MNVFDRVRSVHSRPIQLVREDPDLFAGLDDTDLRHAAVAAAVPRLTCERGPWQGEIPDAASALGLLVIDGLLFRNVTLRSHPRSEIIGPGDVIRPWERDGDMASVRFKTSWEVVEPACLAVLDSRFLEATCRWPSVTAALVGRAMNRCRWLTLQLAITDLRRIEDRLLLLFWHLADRWGRMCGEGVIVPIRLTHELLAQLVGAQRPTVTTGLQRLAESGLLRRRADRHWLLAPTPPAIEAVAS